MSRYLTWTIEIIELPFSGIDKISMHMFVEPSLSPFRKSICEMPDYHWRGYVKKVIINVDVGRQKRSSDYSHHNVHGS